MTLTMTMTMTTQSPTALAEALVGAIGYDDPLSFEPQVRALTIGLGSLPRPPAAVLTELRTEVQGLLAAIAAEGETGPIMASLAALETRLAACLSSF